jgi:hypothetical protein
MQQFPAPAWNNIWNMKIFFSWLMRQVLLGLLLARKCVDIRSRLYS